MHGVVAREFQFRDLFCYEGLPRRLMVGISGGRSSAYQALHALEANVHRRKDLEWCLIFENTGLERWETLDFVDRLDRYIQQRYGMSIVYAEYDPLERNKFRLVDYLSASREGEPMVALLSEEILRRDGTVGVRPLPNPAQRVCTANLKTKTAHRYVRKVLNWPTKYHSLLGYRAEEPKRVKRKERLNAKGPMEGGFGEFPMHYAGVEQDDVEMFFLLGPFDLELDSDFGNCDLCFMASTWKIKQRMVHFALEAQVHMRLGAIPPIKIARWIAWEERVSDRPGVFRKDRPTYRQLWEQVCAGDYESAVPENKNDVCRACTE